MDLFLIDLGWALSADPLPAVAMLSIDLSAIMLAISQTGNQPEQVFGRLKVHDPTTVTVTEISLI